MANNPHAAWNVTTRDWRVPANVVLDNVMQLYRAGQLDQAVANRPDLKRFTDALVTAGHMTLDGGRLVPKLDESGWFKPAAAHVAAPHVSAPPKAAQVPDAYAMRVPK
jgi:hypothetical protein